MSEQENIAKHAKAVVDKAQESLQTIDPSPFTPEAFSLLKSRISEYITELINEASRLAKRDRLDTISAIQVQRANERLVSTASRRLVKHVGTIGGILLGAALSQALAMTLSTQYTVTSVLSTLILGIIGSFMVAVHMSFDGN